MPIERDTPAPPSGQRADAVSGASGAPDVVGTRIRDAYSRSPGVVDHDALQRMVHRGFSHARPRVPLAARILGRWGASGTFYRSRSPFLFARFPMLGSMGGDAYSEATPALMPVAMPPMPAAKPPMSAAMLAPMTRVGRRDAGVFRSSLGPPPDTHLVDPPVAGPSVATGAREPRAVAVEGAAAEATTGETALVPSPSIRGSRSIARSLKSAPRVSGGDSGTGAASTPPSLAAETAATEATTSEVVVTPSPLVRISRSGSGVQRRSTGSASISEEIVRRSSASGFVRAATWAPLSRVASPAVDRYPGGHGETVQVWRRSLVAPFGPRRSTVLNPVLGRVTRSLALSTDERGARGPASSMGEPGARGSAPSTGEPGARGSAPSTGGPGARGPALSTGEPGARGPTLSTGDRVTRAPVLSARIARAALTTPLSAPVLTAGHPEVLLRQTQPHGGFVFPAVFAHSQSAVRSPLRSVSGGTVATTPVAAAFAPSGADTLPAPVARSHIGGSMPRVMTRGAQIQETPSSTIAGTLPLANVSAPQTHANETAPTSARISQADAPGQVQRSSVSTAGNSTLVEASPQPASVAPFAHRSVPGREPGSSLDLATDSSHRPSVRAEGIGRHISTESAVAPWPTRRGRDSVVSRQLILREPWSPNIAGLTRLARVSVSRLAAHRSPSDAGVVARAAAAFDPVRSPAQILANGSRSLTVQAERVDRATDQSPVHVAVRSEPLESTGAGSQGQPLTASARHASPPAAPSSPGLDERRTVVLSDVSAAADPSFHSGPATWPAPLYLKYAVGRMAPAHLVHRVVDRSDSSNVVQRVESNGGQRLESVSAVSPLSPSGALPPVMRATSFLMMAMPAFRMAMPSPMVARDTIFSPHRGTDERRSAQFLAAPLSHRDWARAGLVTGPSLGIDAGGGLVRRSAVSGELMRTTDERLERPHLVERRVLHPVLSPRREGSTPHDLTSALVLVKRSVAPGGQRDSDRFENPGAPAAFDVRRQTAAAPASVSVPVQPGARTESGQTTEAGAAANADELVDKVTRRLLRQLAIERERRGVNSCL